MGPQGRSPATRVRNNGSVRRLLSDAVRHQRDRHRRVRAALGQVVSDRFEVVATASRYRVVRGFDGDIFRRRSPIAGR